MCRDGMELSLAKDAKNNKKIFYRHVHQKRKDKENVPPIRTITRDIEKAEVFNNFFFSLFTASRLPTILKFLNLKTRAGGAKSLPL